MVATFAFRLLPMFVFSVFLTEVAITSAAFLSAPKDTVALVGARVELECSTNNLTLALRWSYYASNNPQRLVALFNGRYVSNASASTYEVHKGPGDGRYDLIIKSAGFSSAGEYTCAEDPFAQRATVAFVTVIASDPVCATNVNPEINGTVENDELWAWCMVTSIGKGIPILRWTFDSTRRVTPNETVNSAGAASTFTSMIKMQVNSSANGAIISCKTIFKIRELPKRPQYTETLSYTHIWNHTANVLYGSRNLNITPLSSTFAVSDSLLCSADGNPSPTYEWTDVERGRVIGRGSVLTLEDIITVVDKEYTFQCTAANVVAGQNISKSAIITFNVTDGQSNLDTTHMYVYDVTDDQMKTTSLNITLNVTASTEKINEAEALSIFSLLITVVGAAVALILILIITIVLVSRACCKATDRGRSVNDNFATQPLMDMEVNLYSEADANVTGESVETRESLGAELNASQGGIQGKATLEPREGLYSELMARQSRAEGNHDKEPYTQLRLFVNAAGTSEHGDYIEIL